MWGYRRVPAMAVRGLVVGIVTVALSATSVAVAAMHTGERTSEAALSQVDADFDGDGLADFAVFRPASGAWHVQGDPAAFFGLSADAPVPADYNGDGITEMAVFRPSVGG